MNADPFDGLDLQATETDPNEKGCRSIVRLKTCYYSTDRGLHMRKDLICVKRLSWDYQILEEDVANIGAEKVMTKIVNLDECEDGFYSVEMCNVGHDWETGYVDDYDYFLVPFDPKKEES